jgi:hypothetical protein
MTKENMYLTIEAASDAAVRLNIKDNIEYRSKHKEDSMLPENPYSYYIKDWNIFGKWNGFLGISSLCNKKHFYLKIEEASIAALKLGISGSKNYREERKRDFKLPAKPDKYYKNWKSWYVFLGKDLKYHLTIDEASVAAIKLNITRYKDYKEKYKEDSKLPANPNKFYGKDWKSWDIFLGKEAKCYYETIEEASFAAIKLGISGSKYYYKERKADSKLPANLKTFYGKNWKSWDIFLNREEKCYYETIDEASNAAIKLGVLTQKEYWIKYKEDPKLSPSPHDYYGNKWKCWGVFLGKDVKNYYKTVKEASISAIKLGIIGARDYNNRYKQDPRLPSFPSKFYRKEWKCWNDFLGKEIKLFYKTIEEASESVIKMGINNSKDYKIRYSEDPKLPCKPREFYKEDWVKGMYKDFFIGIKPKVNY